MFHKRQYKKIQIHETGFTYKGQSHSFEEIEHIFFERTITTQRMNFVKVGEPESGRLILTLEAGQKIKLSFDETPTDLIKEDKSVRRNAKDSPRKGRNAYNTFAKAINTALLLGIIQKSTARGLHLLRELRNDLAHGVELMGDDSKVSQRIDKISKVLKSVSNDEPKWILHGVAIKLVHGICYDYAESRGWNQDDILAQWESIRQRIEKDTAQHQGDSAERSIGRP